MGLNRNINDDSTLAYLFNKTRQGASDALQKAVDKINNTISAIQTTITTITTNMPEWINANISYVDGETIDAKISRLLSGTYLPRGKPFIGVVTSGSRYFTAGFLYTSSNKLYGSFIFSSYNSNSTRGGIYSVTADVVAKRSADLIEVVNKAGDTMTNSLNISRNTTIAQNYPSALYLKPHQTDNNLTYGSCYVAAYDDHDAASNGVNMVVQSGGNVIIGGGEAPSNLYTAAYKNSTDEKLALCGDSTIEFFTNCQTIDNRVNTRIDASGNFTGKAANVTGTVAIANGGTGQTAVSYVSTASSIITAGSGNVIDSAYYAQWGKVAQIWVNWHRTSQINVTAFGGLTAFTVGTIVSGKRPRMSIACNDNGVAGMFFQIDSNGTVTCKSAAPGGVTSYKINANTALNFSCTYILA